MESESGAEPAQIGHLTLASHFSSGAAIRPVCTWIARDPVKIVILINREIFSVSSFSSLGEVDNVVGEVNLSISSTEFGRKPAAAGISATDVGQDEHWIA